MSSKLVVSADAFNLFESEKLTKFKNEINNSCSSENISKTFKNTNDTKAIVETSQNINITKKIQRKVPNILVRRKAEISKLKTYKNVKFKNTLPKKCKTVPKSDKKSSLDEKMEDNTINVIVGEPPRIAINEDKVLTPINSLSVVKQQDTPAVLAEQTSAKKSVFFVKNSSGKSVPLLIKKSVLLTNNQRNISAPNVETNVFLNTSSGKYVTIPKTLITSSSKETVKINETVKFCDGTVSTGQKNVPTLQPVISSFVTTAQSVSTRISTAPNAATSVSTAPNVATAPSAATRVSTAQSVSTAPSAATRVSTAPSASTRVSTAPSVSIGVSTAHLSISDGAVLLENPLSGPNSVINNSTAQFVVTSSTGQILKTLTSPSTFISIAKRSPISSYKPNILKPPSIKIVSPKETPEEVIECEEISSHFIETNNEEIVGEDNVNFNPDDLETISELQGHNKNYKSPLPNPFNVNIGGSDEEINIPLDNPLPEPRNYRIFRPLANTKNILINNQLVPVSLNTKFNIESSTHPNTGDTDDGGDAVINIITNKYEIKDGLKSLSSIDDHKNFNSPGIKIEYIDEDTSQKYKINKKIGAAIKSKKPQIKKTPKGSNPKTKKASLGAAVKKRTKIGHTFVQTPQPQEKLYQLHVEGERSIPEKKVPNFAAPSRSFKDCPTSTRNGLPFLSQMPMYVENSTQTKTILKDTACQTDLYIFPTYPVEEEPPNISQLLEYLLDNSKYNTGMDEVTKIDVMNNSLKCKTPEPEIYRPAPKPLSLKERLFTDLRDCASPDFLGHMPIHNAVLDNKLNAVKRQCYVLRLRRFSIDVENNYSQSALQLAIENNRNQDIIATLLGNGANVYGRDNAGNTLLHSAVLNTNQSVLDLLLSYFNKVDDFINIKNDDGLTPLMIASIEAKPDLVETLFKYGANPNSRDDKSGRTALFHAVELNHTYVINLLLQNRADPQIRNFFGLTALDAAKDLNIPEANIMEKQIVTGSVNIDISPSTKVNKQNKRKLTPNKRNTPANKNNANEKKIKLSVVSKMQKVDLNNFNNKGNSSKTVNAENTLIEKSKINIKKKRTKKD